VPDEKSENSSGECAPLIPPAERKWHRADSAGDYTCCGLWLQAKKQKDIATGGFLQKSEEVMDLDSVRLNRSISNSFLLSPPQRVYRPPKATIQQMGSITLRDAISYRLNATQIPRKVIRPHTSQRT
jgi:hypothetical protein